MPGRLHTAVTGLTSTSKQLCSNLMRITVFSGIYHGSRNTSRQNLTTHLRTVDGRFLHSTFWNRQAVTVKRALMLNSFSRQYVIITLQAIINSSSSWNLWHLDSNNNQHTGRTSGESRFDSLYRQYLCLLQHVRTGSVAHAGYPVGTTGPFSEGKPAGSWRWPLTAA
jgi:hypothetical protein